jgi:plastocyanin
MNKKIIISVIVLVLIIGGGYVATKKKTTQQNIPVVTNENKTAVPVDTATTQSNQIIIKDFAFGPETLTVKKGDTVTWTNQDSAPHQIAGTNFKSEMLSNGGIYSFTFNEIGKFEYICSVHPSMKGTIIVQ